MMKVCNPFIDNIEIMISYKPDKVTEELFQSLFSIYQIRLEISMIGSDFVFDYKYHKINFKRGGSSKDSPD